MNFSSLHASLNHERLLESLAGDDFLLMQDLDGVCMGLVRDPLTRTLDTGYIKAAQQMGDRLLVLTNGEHEGRRGVNRLVEAALGSADKARAERAYLPGLAAGGIQWQGRDGVISHPGVSDAELAFLATVPERMADMLAARLASPPFSLPSSRIRVLVQHAVLDNRVSPTINLNPIHALLGDDAMAVKTLQADAAALCDALLKDASEAGLAASFFVHYAPNLGRDPRGRERLLMADATRAGTHDFQFMPRGAVKEAGVLALLNRWVHGRTGRWPLGADFNVRLAPSGVAALVALAVSRFRAEELPRLVGVGDTVSALVTPHGVQRGGSDRGFLMLVQALGRCFNRDNIIAYVDSSAGEVQRPSIDVATLASRSAETLPPPPPALSGISDPDDPLRINVVFPDGYRDYCRFFTQLARC